MRISELTRPMLATFCAITLVTQLLGCGSPPELPPKDTMDLPDFQNAGTGGALLAVDQTTSNVEQAAVAVGLVSVAVFLALLPARTFFWGVVSSKASRDGDEWVWENTFPLLGYEGELRGSMPADTLSLEMLVTGTRAGTNQLQDFTWFTGEHQAKQGAWELFAPEKSGPVLRIDWARAAPTDKELTFTNVEAGVDGNGDELAYALKGDLASMSIHDEMDAGGLPADFDVVWNLATGAGKLTRVSGEQLCWDTLANGQVDIACPTTAWP